MRVLVAATVALTCQHAYAGSPSLHPSEPSDESVVPSYRGSTLASDGVAVGALAIGVAARADFMAVLGLATYVVGAPAMHLTNQRYGRAAASVAMRVGLPLLGAVIGDSLPRDCGPSGDCMGPPAALFLGLAAGGIAAMAIDTIFLAKGDPHPSQPQLAWRPVAGTTRDGLAIGIAGQF